MFIWMCFERECAFFFWVCFLTNSPKLMLKFSLKYQVGRRRLFCVLLTSCWIFSLIPTFTLASPAIGPGWLKSLVFYLHSWGPPIQVMLVEWSWKLSNKYSDEKVSNWIAIRLDKLQLYTGTFHHWLDHTSTSTFQFSEISKPGA